MSPNTDHASPAQNKQCFLSQVNARRENILRGGRLEDYQRL